MSDRDAAPSFDASLARPWDYDALRQEGLALIPVHAPEWTNHNVSDPGITLLELFAYFTEVLAYRALRVAPDAKLNLLGLLGADADLCDALRRSATPAVDVDAALRAHAATLTHCRCAITPADFEMLACEVALRDPICAGGVRARAFAGVDLRRVAAGASAAALASDGEAQAHVSVLLMPRREADAQALAALCEHVESVLSERCLLTTRVQVLAPVEMRVRIGCRVALRPGVSMATAAASIDAALQREFGDDFDTGPAQAATMHQHELRLTRIVAAIDGAAGVDWVDAVTIVGMGPAGPAHPLESQGPATDLIGLRIGRVSTLAQDTRLGGHVSAGGPRFERDDDGEVVAVQLRPWERPHLVLDVDSLQVLPVGAAEVVR